MGALDPSLKWPWPKAYREKCQSQEQIARIAALLDMDAATALVDVGCGNGAFSIEIARRNPNCNVFACDPHPGGIAECRECCEAMGLTNLEMAICPGEEMPLTDSWADRVLIRCTLHYFTDPEAALAEVARLLRPGGLLVIDGPGNASDALAGEVLNEMALLDNPDSPRCYYNVAQVSEMLERIGFSIISAEVAETTRPINDEAAGIIMQREAADRLNLQRASDGQWIATMGQITLVARRN